MSHKQLRRCLNWGYALYFLVAVMHTLVVGVLLWHQPRITLRIILFTLQELPYWYRAVMRCFALVYCPGLVMVDIGLHVMQRRRSSRADS
jgi:hypothetical protein